MYKDGQEGVRRANGPRIAGEQIEIGDRVQCPGGGVLPIMDYTGTGRIRPRGVPFSGWGYIKG